MYICFWYPTYCEKSKLSFCYSNFNFERENGKKILLGTLLQNEFSPSDVWSSIGLRCCLITNCFCRTYELYKLTHAYRKSEHFHDFLIKTHLLVDNCKHPCTHTNISLDTHKFIFADIVNFRMTAYAMFIYVTFNFMLA